MLYFSPHQSGVKITLVAIAAASILFYIAKIGMGDLKLLMGLLITQGALVISRSYLYLSICALLATLISQLIYRRTLQGSVAFAHVILLPFIIIYLAI
jgi:Flp pilus assembly protein protease CpaA